MASEQDFWPGEFAFCPMCAGRLTAGRRKGRLRMMCSSCGWVHFRDPGVGVAVLLRDDAGRVLLVERAPRSTQAGRWCIPCGYVDYGEEIRSAAAREVEEETGLACRVGEPVQVASNFHDPAKLTVGIWFAGTVTGGTLRAGDDASDVGYFALEALPELAFDTDRELLDRLSPE
jgi:8-oxo-dGTP diphosphatase